MSTKKNIQTKHKQIHFHDVEDKFDVEYKRDFFTKKQADNYFQILEQNLVYNSDKESQIMIMGKKINIPRKQVAYGEPNTFYSFSGNRVKTRDWHNDDDPLCQAIQEIREKVQQETGKDFNFVLINRYANGDDYIGFHADDEKELGPEPTIVGITFGAERPFQFKPAYGLVPKTVPETVEISLAHGSFVVMNHPTNAFWKHSVPKRANIKNPRISLTFRHITAD